MPEKPPIPVLLPDFREVSNVLRALLIEQTRQVGDPGFRVALKAVQQATRLMAAQSVVYLYNHLCHVEQWREAATLLAFALPHDVRSHPEVRRCVEHASRMAAALGDPETERAGMYLTLVHEMSDEWAKFLSGMPLRARYFLMVSRLIGAKVAIEFAAGCGMNVMQAAQAAPAITWVGVDISRGQIEHCREQAARLEIPNVFFETPEEGTWKGRGDCVGLLDALEHTVYPDELVAATEAYVAPGGRLCVVVPNGPWDLHAKQVHDPDVTGVEGVSNHVAVASPETLMAYLSQRGTLVDVQVLDGDGTGNGSVAVTYLPEKS